MNEISQRVHEVFEQRWNNLCCSKDGPKWLSQLEELADIEWERWERLLIKYDAEIKRIRRRHGLPLRGSDVNIFWDDWNKFIPFQHDFDSVNWDLSPSDLVNLRLYILYEHGMFFSMGFPAGNLNTLEPIITKTTIPTNPLIQEHMLRLQVLGDPPPQPKFVGRKKDPQPLIEWYKRHPKVAQKEIGYILQVNEVTVSRWLSPSKSVKKDT